MTELIEGGGQTWVVPTVADAMLDMFKRDPNWSLFYDGGFERFDDVQDDDRVCPECGTLRGFVWTYMWVNRTLNMWANIDSFYCPNNHQWTLVCVPPVDIDRAGFSGVGWAVA